MSDEGFRSSLGSMASLFREPDAANGRSAAAKIWHQTGMIVIVPDHYSWAGQTRAVQLAEELWGKRKSEGGSHGKRD